MSCLARPAVSFLNKPIWNTSHCEDVTSTMPRTVLVVCWCAVLSVWYIYLTSSSYFIKSIFPFIHSIDKLICIVSHCCQINHYAIYFDMFEQQNLARASILYTLIIAFCHFLYYLILCGLSVSLFSHLKWLIIAVTKWSQIPFSFLRVINI